MKLESEYKHLFSPTSWGTTRVAFHRCTKAPPAHLISNVTVVPFVAARCLILQLEGGRWEVPGGTLEPNEHYLETARRELLEEAGAQLVKAQIIGAWECHSSASTPYRAHLPHPDFYRLALLAEVEMVGAPTNPEGGERVISVECVDVDEAARKLSATGRDELADLYRFAASNISRKRSGSSLHVIR